jgi:hypothetical protein
MEGGTIGITAAATTEWRRTDSASKAVDVGFEQRAGLGWRN